jgi:hypothetical protein
MEIAKAFYKHCEAHSWDAVGKVLINVTIALSPLDLPVYVLLWLTEFLPAVASKSEFIIVIEGVIKSRRKVLAQRAAAPQKQRREERGLGPTCHEIHEIFMKFS